MTATPRPRILLVDDDPTFLRAAARLLGRHADVFIASHVQSAILQLEQMPVDIVVTDYDLGPGETGFQLLTWCRDHRPAARRVLLSAQEPVSIPRLSIPHTFVPKSQLLERLPAILGEAHVRAAGAAPSMHSRPSSP